MVAALGPRGWARFPAEPAMRAWVAEALAAAAPGAEGDTDVTDAYTAARARVFRDCRRVEVPLAPGEAVLLHRLLLHGVAPWADAPASGPEGRATAYLRPPMPGGVRAWLTAP